MNTQLTVEHLLELIDALPKERAYDYVIAGDNKAVLHFVNIADQTISIDKENVNGTIKSANITSETINIIANGIKAYIPFTMDSILNGSGSSRSAWETIIANTSEFYKCMINRNKHLVWVPDSPHEIGQICEISEKELPYGTNNYLEPSIANFITRYDKQKYSFEELVNIFKRIHDEAKENRKRVQAINMYGILYAPHLLEYKVNGPDSIAARALGNDNIGSMGDEMGRGIAIGMILREHLKPTISPNKNKTLYAATSSSYLPYLTALRTKPFMLLAGISGTGKSRIVRELAFKSCPSYLQDEDGTTPGNYCMIEVKPNWHDSSELLGYYSNIAKQYVFTDFVKFLLKAKLYSDVPFFVCMDEMNLAPVEQYFAEFLSVLETRKQTESGIKTGALVKGHYFKRIKSVNEYDNVQTDADVYTLLEIPITAGQKEELAKTNSLKTDGLTLPENVFVIGTVNMDDTTHQFSRKVLDRAMTIEMNGGELKDMFGHSSDLEYLPEENVWKIDQFKPKHVNADEVLEAHPAEEDALKTQLADKLDAINQVLKDTPFVVSYRVLNELVIYAGVLLDDGKETEEAINDAVDQITLMKILPRIEGDEDLLGNAKDENNRLCQLMKVVGPKSQAKIKEMNRRLESGFTRFWP